MRPRNAHRRAIFEPSLSHLLAVTLIVVAAAWVRLHGTAWDGFASLHPDERHMIFVLSDMRAALDAFSRNGVSFADLWFNTGVSGLDPRLNGRPHVYGEAPLLSVALLAWQQDLNGWGNLLLLGRTVTALLDTSIVVAVYILAWTLSQSGRAALLAAVLYAAAPTALQLANFYTVDTWLTAAMAWSLAALAALARTQTRGDGLALFAGAFAGLALASKITGGLLAAPAFVVAIILAKRRGLAEALWAALMFAVTALLVLRVTSPFLFSGPGFFDVWPSQAFIDDVKDLSGLTGAENFPPNWQWLAGYPPHALLRDVVAFGTGPILAVLFAICLFGYVWRSAAGVITLALAATVVAWSINIGNTPLRYIAPALPAMAALTALATSRWPGWAVLGVAALALWWGSGTARLHMSEHPRVEASRWLWALPAGTVLANETAWDEGLPIAVYAPEGWQGGSPVPQDHFTHILLDITAPDTPEKARSIAAKIAEADYVIVSSGRQRDVMPRLPQRFPLTTEYYRLLAQEAHCLTRERRYERGYPLPMLALSDAWVQEPWRIYDHPIVEIYKRGDCYDAALMEADLIRALER